MRLDLTVQTADMLKNYLKTALRNLSRNKIYSFINIFGLSIGLACAMLIMLFVKDEWSFDRFQKQASTIYRVVSKRAYKGKSYQTPITGYLAGPRFTQHVPGIKSFVRFQQSSEDMLKGPDVESLPLFRVDSNFFSVFTFPLISGDPATCLLEPHSLVLSEDAAKKQFGTTHVLGKIVLLKDDSVFVPYKVTAVAANCPENSSIRFQALSPIRESAADAADNDHWFDSFLNTFVVLDEKANPQKVAQQMQRFYEQDAKIAFGRLSKKYGYIGDMATYFLQPYTDIHLDPDLPPVNGMTGGSSPTYSYILSGIALFILLIACINFINLTVARSIKRAKEIGIRKVIGGDRKSLMLQFLGESFFLCGVAFILAILLAWIGLPLFNDLANKKLSLSYLLDARLVTGYTALFILTGLLAGFYPALVLSGYNPVQTLYSRFQIAGKDYLRKSLIILQFTLASFLIVATFIIYSQFNFLTHADLGYDDRNLVEVQKDGTTHSKAAVFKTALLAHPGIAEVGAKNSGADFTAAKLSNDSIIQFRYETIDESFLPELGIPVVAGRNFSPSSASDSNNAVLVNEAFVKQAGWKKGVGQPVRFFTDGDKTYRVIGVVKDYHYTSLSEKIGPQLFTMKNDNPYGTFLIKIARGNTAQNLQIIQKTFHEVFPLSPYSYVFKSDENKRQYEDIARWREIILFGAALTILISCIGLFGLSVLTAEKRTKEIGIRKVLGASVAGVARSLSMDFLALVLIALVIAMPPAWMAGRHWLERYPYRIVPGWSLFLSSALLVILIALITVSFQAVKAARANPVKSLRTE